MKNFRNAILIFFLYPLSFFIFYAAGDSRDPVEFFDYVIGNWLSYVKAEVRRAKRFRQ